LARARQELIRARLIAYEKPLYQVLSLDDLDAAAARSAATSSPRFNAPQTVGQIFREMRPPT
jgi:hypothetical protein